jgi:O-antigen/teichoic acid export membrane protein
MPEATVATAVPVAAGPARLARDLVWSITGTAVSALSQWAIVVVLARYGSPSMLGEYALGVAISTPIVLLASLALRTVQVTDTHAGFAFADYLRLRVVGMVLALGLIGGAALLSGSHGVAVVVLVGLARVLDGVADIFLGLCQRWAQITSVGVAMVVGGLVKVAVVAVLLVVTGSIVWTAVGLFAASALGGVAFCAWIARLLVRREAAASAGVARPRTAVRLASLTMIALPLGFASGVASITANVPRYLVEHRLGAAALGTFTALGYVVPAANSAFASVAQIVLPKMARLNASGDLTGLVRLTWRLVGGCALVGAGAVLAAAAFGRPALDTLYGPEYAEQVHLLIPLAAAAAIGGVTYVVGTALSAVRRFGNQLAASTGTMLLTAGAGLVLVPRYGLSGAAWLVLLAMASEGALKGFLLRRALREKAWD